MVDKSMGHLKKKMEEFEEIRNHSTRNPGDLIRKWQNLTNKWNRLNAKMEIFDKEKM
jgi:hypothetical protein